MNIISTIARLLLGILFVIAGGSDFFISNPPPLPGLAGAFNDIFFKSHFVLFVGAAQFVIGALLISNRFVPVALIMLAAFIYNSFAFHITMMPSGLFGPIVALILGLLVAWKYRPLFAPILAATPTIPES